MRLISPKAWAAKYFSAESKPQEQKCYRWLRSGKIPGRKVGGAWFVDEDECWPTATIWCAVFSKRGMEMGRNRANPRAGWPENLYPNRDGFKYRNPVTRKETWMGTNRSRAFAAAKKLNTHLGSMDDLVAKALGRGQTVADTIRVFRADVVPGRKWAAKTAENYESLIRRTEATLGQRELDTLTVKDCAEFIRAVTESARGRQQFRVVLGWILACAVEEGWMDSNPALQIRKFSYERQRARLTIEQYQLIWAAAPPFLRNAMDLSHITLLRREDVANARFVDVRDGALWIVPGKTEGSSCGSR